MSGSGGVSGAPNLAVVNAITQFSGGTQTVWNSVTIPIPAGLVVYATDTTAVKMGNGASLYSELPTLFTLNSILTINEQLAALLAGAGNGSGSGRLRLTANATFYVAATGSDTTGNGTQAEPWATLQHAFSTVQAGYDLANFTVTFACSGNLTAGVNVYGPLVGQNGAPNIVFDGGGSAQVVVANGNVFAANFGGAFIVQNFAMLSTTGATTGGEGTILACNQGIIRHQGNTFGSCVNSHIAAFGSGAIIAAIGSYAIAGGAASGHIFASGAGLIFTTVTGGITVTLSGIPAFPAGFAVVLDAGDIVYQGVTFVGTQATGPRYLAGTASMISTNNAGPNYFPGSVAGTTVGTGVYDNTDSITAASGTGRTVLTQNTTFYVAASGSDTTGTGTQSAPWATLQHAVVVVQNGYDLANYMATFSCSGTLTAGASIAGQFVGQNGPATVVFDGGGSAQVNGVDISLFDCNDNGAFTVQNFGLLSTTGVTSGGAGIVLGCNQGTIYHQGNTFGSASNAHIVVSGAGGLVMALGSYAISGGAINGHLQAGGPSEIYAASTSNIVVTLTNTPAFPNGFVYAQIGGTVVYGGVTFTGLATGPRYRLFTGGIISTNGAGGSYFPGNAAGSNDGTGTYDSTFPAPAVRVRLTANTTFYVNASTGSDTTGNGTSALPWATIGYAVALVQGLYDLASNTITFACTGNFTNGASLNGPLTGQIGPTAVIFDGGGTAQISASSYMVFYCSGGAGYTVQNFGLLTNTGPTTGGQGSILASNSGMILHQNNNYGSSTNAQISAYGSGAFIQTIGNYTISGGSPIAHIAAGADGAIWIGETAGTTITFTGAGVTGENGPAFPSGFAVAAACGVIDATLMAFDNATWVTGYRYNIEAGGVIRTNGGGPSYFPGNHVGITDGTGSYT